MKRSKRGRLTLVQDTEFKTFRTIEMTEPIKQNERNMMEVVYHNGPIEAAYTSFLNVREEAAKGLR